MSMSALAENFVAALGRPDPATPNGLRFKDAFLKRSWERIHSEIGSGWFQDRFLYLFGEGLERLQPCLDAWSFLVPPKHRDRMILGRNAYGAILVLEDGNSPDPSVHMLDPLVVEYWTDSNIGFENLLGHWLPRNKVPRFLDKDLYDAWRNDTGQHLDDDMILAARAPLSLGGAMAADNFQEEEIVSYYETTAPIYKKAVTKAKIAELKERSSRNKP